ncbi:MAG: FAD-dependent oxidoreductase [Gemmatimonadetes bacterium]|jgi:hypothetical protein|nr:FAD-dependent oxidoreductase [Gemmatimonadota bacterium]
MNEQYDVIVIGGGTAGVVAAVQAGRVGARTLLVEKTGMLGGTTTVGGVNFPGLFHAWGRQVIAGIGWELVTRCVEETGGTLPDFADYDRHHAQLQVRVNRFVYAALCDEAVADAGVDILLHTMLADVRSQAEGHAWQVTLCTKSGLTELDAAVVIDATGDANATKLAGLPVHVPDENQPATLTCEAGGYDPADLDIDSINRAFDAEVRAGRLSYTDASWSTTEPNIGRWLHSYGVQANHIHHINARDSDGKTRLELTSRRSLLRLYRFLRQQPGLEKLVIEQVSPECGVRETATIQGMATVTAEDYQSGRVWEDAVCHSYYPIDLHISSGTGLDMVMLAEGVVPTIPRAALLPAGSRNFIVAGRCISSDRLANSALRVQASCMATGQAAGAMAALSVKCGLAPEELPMADVRSLLREHKAIVPQDS